MHKNIVIASVCGAIFVMAVTGCSSKPSSDSLPTCSVKTIRASYADPFKSAAVSKLRSTPKPLAALVAARDDGRCKAVVTEESVNIRDAFIVFEGSASSVYKSARAVAKKQGWTNEIPNNHSVTWSDSSGAGITAVEIKGGGVMVGVALGK